LPRVDDGITGQFEIVLIFKRGNRTGNRKSI
jgi:hypothetical protein